MKYRDAKNIHKGDEVIRIHDDLSLIVSSIEVYGQFKKVRLNCYETNTSGGPMITVYHNEVR
jgi:hypothetical protein